MKILLTGGHGFTGRHFLAHAEAAGHQVLPLGVDLRDKAAVAAAVRAVDFEALVHLAAISFVGYAEEAAFYAVNVVGTANLLAAVAARPVPPKRILLASSANVYGNCEASPITENQPPAPVNHYAISKLAMECIARTYLDRLPIVITRPFNYTGPGQAMNFVIPKIVDHFARRTPFVELGNLAVEREFNNVRMVCDAYIALLTAGDAGEVYNVCSGQPHTLQQVIDTLADLTGHCMEVRVSPELVRANEVHRLCGDPTKLRAVCAQGGIKLHQPELRDTLQWMLREIS